MRHAFIFILITFFLACSDPSGDYSSNINKADSLYQAKEYRASLKAFEAAFSFEKKDYLHLYNAGCTAALAGENSKAFEFLDAAIDHGWTNVQHFMNDRDLASLHQDENWNNLIRKAQRKNDELKAIYAPVQAELLRILEEDQGPKNAFHATSDPHKRDSLKRVGMKLDSINLIKVKSILETYGWVGIDKIGLEANRAIFLSIQHADLATQEKYLPMMREAVRKGDAFSNQLALLEDRVLIRQGKKQIHGSQVELDQNTGRYIVSPIDDPYNVDNRRASVGLQPLSEYLQNWEIMWDAEEHKRMLLEKEGK